MNRIYRFALFSNISRNILPVRGYSVRILMIFVVFKSMSAFTRPVVEREGLVADVGVFL